MPFNSFDPFCFDIGGGRVWHAGEEMCLRPKSLAVLRYLVERPGRVISKDELLQSVWAGTAVSDTVLRVCIREIRRALHDPAAAPRFVETVGRRGYRFSRAAALRRNGFVGRDMELQQLDGWLRRALSGTRQAVFITGEAGIGKSALIALFLEHFGARDGVRLASSQCLEPYAEGEPYLPLLDLLSRLCRGPYAERTVAVLARYAPTWLLKMPALVDEAAWEPLRRRAQAGGRERMVREFAEAVEALAGDAGLVLVVEDLQWSDVFTVDLLSYLAQRAEPARLLLVMTYRPATAALRNHPLEAMKGGLQIRGCCNELPLEPLIETEISQYLAHQFGGVSFPTHLAALIRQHTEGNALFMVSVLDDLVRRGTLVHDRDQWRLTGAVGTPLPDTLQQLIAKQLEALQDQDVRLLETASVVGMQFTAATIAECAKATEDDVDERCAELVGKGLFIRPNGIVEWPDGTVSGSYEFCHALHRTALYERLLYARRVRLHRAIGERMERGYGTPATENAAAMLAEHFEAGMDRRRAIQYRRQAGELALRGGRYAEAAFHLRRALRLLAPRVRVAATGHTEPRLSPHPRFGTLRSTGATEVKRLYERVCQLSTQLNRAVGFLLAFWGVVGSSPLME